MFTFINTFGTYDFNATIILDSFQNWMFWLIWVMLIFVNNIIFFNFIIAEVGASYSNVKANVDVFVLQERGNLISESEDMMRARYGGDTIKKWKHIFPKALIIREME